MPHVPIFCSEAFEGKSGAGLYGDVTMELDWSVGEIVADGYDRAMVERVARLVLLNEYKRRQAPPGIRISRRAFGRDWRYPITSGYGFEP